MTQYGIDEKNAIKATKKYYQDEDDMKMDFVFLSRVMGHQYPTIEPPTARPTTETREQRIGQEEFRNQLLQRYRGCIVTKNTHTAELEAAHLIPHHNGRDQTINNGIILEANLHKTFDKYQWSINPRTSTVITTKRGKATNGSGSIDKYQGMVVHVHPDSTQYLEHHYNHFSRLEGCKDVKPCPKGTREDLDSETWELGNLGTRKLGNSGTRELGNSGTRELGNSPSAHPIFFSQKLEKLKV